MAHIAEYGGLAALLYYALDPRHQKSKKFWLSLGGSFAYAVSDEIHQAFVPGRQCSLRDIGLDLLGALAALSLLRISQIVMRNTP
jgi:VanZ family protein